MVFAICILSGLLLFSIFIIAALWIAIGKLMEVYIKSHPEESMKLWFDKNIEEKYPCSLLLSVKEYLFCRIKKISLAYFISFSK